MLVSNGLHPPSDHACYDLQLYNAELTSISTSWNLGMCTMMEDIWLHSWHTKDLDTADLKEVAARYSTFLVFHDSLLVEASVARREAK